MAEIDYKKIDELIVECQSGDSIAFGKVYDLLVDKIYRYIYFRVDYNDVEDLVGVVFMKAWENIGKYKKGKVPFLAWLYTISHNLVVDHYRTHRGLNELKVDIKDERSDADPQNHAEKGINDYLLRKALSKLRDNYKQILILRFISDLSVEETAAVLNCSRRLVRVTQFRALQSLKKEFCDMGVDNV